MPRRMLLLLLSLVLLSGCFPTVTGPTSGNTPEEMFAALLLDPVPPEVSDMQGVGDSWQGYQFFLRFNAPDEVRADLLAAYEEVPCADVLLDFALPTPSYDQFNPAWSPESVAQPRCYQQREVQNSWTHAGEHFMLVDSARSVIYFVGVGA